MIWTQTLALLEDAYRELQSKKMFWIVLILNVLGILAFSLVGVSGQSLKVLWFEPFGPDPGAMLLYKQIYSYGVVGFWLTWFATVLALISTAGIFPDFLASGSVDLYLAKPIGRLRLFFTKYLAGLLFVALQVTVFTVLSFLVLGIRAGLWEPGLFAAIPLVVIFFSYLFSISTLLGVLTRSTIAALLLTLLAWSGMWLVDRADRAVREFAYGMTLEHARIPRDLPLLESEISRLAAATASAPATRTSAAPGRGGRGFMLDDATLLQIYRARRDRLLQRQTEPPVPHGVEVAEDVIYWIKTLVPKTRDTIVLLDRVLFKDKELQEASKQADGEQVDLAAPGPPGGPRGAATAQLELDRERPVWWVLGTSLLFEGVLLGLAAWRFCTRDY